MFGELRSILAEPRLDVARWHAWLADESWTLEGLHEHELYSVRQMQARHDLALFSVPDDVLSALIYGSEIPGVYMRQPERLWLCTHLELRPDAMRAVSWTHYPRVTLHDALKRISLKALRVMSLHGLILRQFMDGSEHALLSQAMCEEVESIELWGDAGYGDFAHVTSQHESSERWLEAITDDALLKRVKRCRIRQFGLTGELLQTITRAQMWQRLEALDMSYNRFDERALSRLAQQPSESLRELVMYGYDDVASAASWEHLAASMPSVLSIRYSPGAFDDVSVTPPSPTFRGYNAQTRIWMMLNEAQGVQQHVCDADVLMCGRSPRLRDAPRDVFQIMDQSVARIHARLIHYKGARYVMDLQSTNGSYVGNDRAPAGTPTRVQPGQSIMIARVKLRLEP
jgi:hypothetical protein